ncbi:putative cell cycle checkpoint protein [Blattamonas nauphoetae]|uniref:Cell cycle checkpoint protein n=1 Tax=Blattamonas nauphoetae TaxID=2049346 RepID=A0ABQ9Y120_9EUKA|nr:putative cell cycle checkpoint protein [Blattamonas nauphoetae]
MAQDQQTCPVSFLSRINPAVLPPLIDTLKWKKQQTINIAFSQNNVRFMVMDDIKSLFGVVSLQNEVFDEFTLAEGVQPYEVTVPLDIFLDSLKICSSSSLAASLSLCCQQDNSAIILTMQEGNVITDCCVKSVETKQLQTFNFNSFPLVAKASIQTDHIVSALFDLSFDHTLDILFTLDKTTGMTLRTPQELDATEIVIPATCFEQIELDTPVSLWYSLQNFTHSLLPSTQFAGRSGRTLIRVADTGLLSVVHTTTLVHVGRREQTVEIEFDIVPVTMDDDQQDQVVQHDSLQANTPDTSQLENRVDEEPIWNEPEDSVDSSRTTLAEKAKQARLAPTPLGRQREEPVSIPDDPFAFIDDWEVNEEQMRIDRMKNIERAQAFAARDEELDEDDELLRLDSENENLDMPNVFHRQIRDMDEEIDDDVSSVLIASAAQTRKPQYEHTSSLLRAIEDEINKS